MRPIAARGATCDPARVSRPEILLWIVVLLVLEVNHLKWIWWEFWDCRRCLVKHKDCSCGATRAWVMYL